MAERDSAAKRRRDRRLRMHWRHEQLTLRLALAAALHHSRDVRPVTYNAPRSQTTSVAGNTEFFSLYEEELGGTRPDWLFEVRPQGRDQRRTLEQFVDSSLVVPSLDVPVPQMEVLHGGLQGTLLQTQKYSYRLHRTRIKPPQRPLQMMNPACLDVTTFVQPPPRFKFALEQAQHAILSAITYHGPSSHTSEPAWKALVLSSWLLLGHPAVNASGSNCAHILEARLGLFWAED